MSEVPNLQVLPNDGDVRLKRRYLLQKCFILLIWKWPKLQGLGEDRSRDYWSSLLGSPPKLEHLRRDLDGLLVNVPWGAQIIVGYIRGILGPVPIHRRVEVGVNLDQPSSRC